MIVVCMIVKDEAETIVQTLDSVAATLGPELLTIVIHDTGSTDRTPELCAAWGGAHKLVRVQCVLWQDFSTNCNLALADGAARALPGDLLLMLDAGTLLSGDPKLPRPKTLPAPSAWNVAIKVGSILTRRPQVFVPGSGWHYEGRIHEAAVHLTGENAIDCGLVVDYCLADPARPERWHRDLALLEDDYSPRGRFYYAQTLDLIGKRAEAFFWYMHRAARSDGWVQETCMAYIRAIPLAPTYELAQWCAHRAADLCPDRGEAHLQAALYGASCAEGALDWMTVHNYASEALLRVPGPDALFIDMDREWRAQELCARAYFYQGNKSLAKQIWTSVLDDVPEWAQTQIRENLRFCDE